MSDKPSFQAWTDGAASGNPGPAGWAVLINGELHSGWLPRATNNQMELFAIQQALELCPPNCHLEIVTDSQLAIGWLVLGYRCHNPLLRSTIESVFLTAKERGVTFSLKKTKGHALIDQNNDKVDRAARAASKLARNILAAPSYR